MSKLHSSSKIVKVLIRNGFGFVSQRGSHGKFRKTVGKRVLTAIVPMSKKEIPFGTFRSILKQAELTEEHFK